MAHKGKTRTLAEHQIIVDAVWKHKKLLDGMTGELQQIIDNGSPMTPAMTKHLYDREMERLEQVQIIEDGFNDLIGPFDRLKIAAGFHP